MLEFVLAVIQAASSAPTLSVPMDANFQVEGRLLPLSACAAGPSATAHVRLGSADLAYPAASVVSFVARQVHAGGSAAEPEMTHLDLPATAGCPETPLEAATLEIDPGLDALPNGLLLAAVTPGVSATQMATMRDSGRCDQSLPDFIACGGSVTVGGQPVPVVALIARTATARGGGALFAVCENVEGEPMCEVEGGRESLSYKAVLARGLPTVAAMAAADAAAFDLIQPAS